MQKEERVYSLIDVVLSNLGVFDTFALCGHVTYLNDINLRTKEDPKI